MNGTQGINLGGYKTYSTPVVTSFINSGQVADNFVFFQGTDNSLWRINLDGSGGVRLGGYNTASPPFVIQPANQPQIGTVVPRYEILTVVYAPPGTASSGGSSGSKVVYGASSTTGTTTSISSSFQAGVNVSVSAGLDIAGASVGANVDFNYSNTTTNSSSYAVTKTATSTIMVTGPSVNGIDHDYDLFYLWLNPMLNVTIDPENNLNWELGVNGPNMIIQYVYAGWLKDPSKMPAGIKQQLDNAHISPQDDYPKILSVNPFSSDGTVIDPNRFLQLNQSFPYEPPYSSSDTPPTDTYAVSNTTTNTTTNTDQVQYGVSVTVSAGFGGPFSASLKTTGSFEWTNTASSSTSSQSTQSATVTIGGPAYGYDGPVDLLVYWDTIYNSFLFAFPPEAPAAAGVVADQSGKPAGHKAVTLTVGPNTLTGFTDAGGEYRFYTSTSGQGQLSVEGQNFTVPVGQGLPKSNLRLT